MMTDDAIEQVEKCDFACEGGPLKNNVGWLHIKEQLQTITALQFRVNELEGRDALRDRTALECAAVITTLQAKLTDGAGGDQAVCGRSKLAALRTSFQRRRKVWPHRRYVSFELGRPSPCC
jgi:hypothetical protein